MNQKIEWYREVLEIEPNSKIFFPLSRMLAKDGRPDEAIAVLRQGVGRHPDHVEARLFLVELLYSCGRAVELQQEIDVLSVLFKQYPGFWRAWGERLFEEDNSRDAGLAAIFLAAFLQNLPVSWAGVIEHGLKSLVGGESVRPSATAMEAYPVTPDPPRAQEPSPPQVKIPSEPVYEPAAKAPLEAVHPEPVEFETSGEEEEDEPITLRTRSMADILAEQGDVAGALDIYTELIAAATTEKEKTELNARMDALSGKNVPSVAEGGAETAARPAQEEKKDWLALLAQRLEARSLQ